MSRKIFIIVFVIFCLVVSATVSAQETRDERAVRTVIEKELKGALEGKPEQMKSCYADDFIGFSAWQGGNVAMHRLHKDGDNSYIDPEDWRVSISTPQELDTYAEAFRDYPERIKKVDVERGNEVASTKVKGDCAIGVTRHWGTWKDEDTNENVRFEARSVWMLKKVNGEWKIFSNIGQVAVGMSVRKSIPTSQ